MRNKVRKLLDPKKYDGNIIPLRLAAADSNITAAELRAAKGVRKLLFGNTHHVRVTEVNQYLVDGEEKPRPNVNDAAGHVRIYSAWNPEGLTPLQIASDSELWLEFVDPFFVEEYWHDGPLSSLKARLHHLEQTGFFRCFTG